MTTEELISHIRVIPDYPVKGIMFQDVSTLVLDAGCLRELSDRLYDEYRDKGVTKVVGLESRGFILGADLAVRLGAGFVMLRKAGKLPAEKLTESYAKEYGTDTIEMHVGSITEDDVVVIHDDLLATGGTIAAAARLVDKFHPAKVYLSFVVNLTDCPRIAEFPTDMPMSSLMDIKEFNQ